MKKLIIFCILIALFNSCHYSCFNCTGPYYISCLSCVNKNPISVVQDPGATPPAYWSSVYPTGTCVDTIGAKANPLGIIIFIILSLSCVIISTKQSFYLFLTIQTFGLYNLLDIAWVNPIGYLLESMQYLMIWSFIGSKFKTTDYTFIVNKYYRLNNYMYQTDIGLNIILIAIFTIISLVLLIIILIISVQRKKQKHQKQQKNQKQVQVIFQKIESERSQEQKPTCMQKFTQKILNKVAKFLLSVLYFMSQETALVLLVSLVFKINFIVIILSVIYLHVLIFVMSYAYYYRVQYFQEKNVMYVNFAKKVILPIMVVVPLKYQFLFFFFAAVFIILEIIFDCYNGLYKKMNRLAFYKIIQILIVVLLIVYYLVESTKANYSSSKAAAIACSFAIAFYLFLFVAVELPLGIKQRFFNKNKLKDQNQPLNNQNQQTINDLQLQNKQKQKQEMIEMNNIQLQNMSSQDSQQNDQKNIPKAQQKATKDGDSSFQRSITRKQPQKVEQVEPPKPSPPPKKRRKQILDPELRMRYGI